jgi:hypothetical protein
MSGKEKVAREMKNSDEITSERTNEEYFFCLPHLNAFSVFPDPRARFESRIMINLRVLMCVEYRR